MDFFGSLAKEQRPQFFWQGKGNHEIRSTDALAEFALDPLCGGILAALRAGAVVARMKVEFLFITRVTGMKVPTHFRSAAVSDSPCGAALCLSHCVLTLTQMIRQETPQRVDDGGCHGERPAWFT